MADTKSIEEFLNEQNPGYINPYSIAFVIFVVASTVIPLHTQKPKFLASRNFWFYIGTDANRYRVILTLNELRRLMSKKPEDRLTEFKKIIKPKTTKQKVEIREKFSHGSEVKTDIGVDATAAKTNGDGGGSILDNLSTGVKTPPTSCPSNAYLSESNGETICEDCKENHGVDMSGKTINKYKSEENCTVKLCLVSERVETKKCVPCPYGATDKSIGDNPTHDDTVCDFPTSIEEIAEENNFTAKNMLYTYKDYNIWWLLEYYLFILGIISILVLFRFAMRYAGNILYKTDEITGISNIADIISVLASLVLIYFLDEDYRNPEATTSYKIWTGIFIFIIMLLMFGHLLIRYFDEFSFNLLFSGNMMSYENIMIKIKLLTIPIIVLFVMSFMLYYMLILFNSIESFVLTPSSIEDKEEKSIQDLIDEQTRSN